MKVVLVVDVEIDENDLDPDVTEFDQIKEYFEELFNGDGLCQDADGALTFTLTAAHVQDVTDLGRVSLQFE